MIARRPETPDTLRVRLMGAGATLKRALAEFDALPEGSKLRTMLWPHVTGLRLALRADPSPEAQEIAMDAEKIHNKLGEQQLRKGRKEGRKEGHLAGLQEGLQEGLRTAIAQVCSTRRLRLTAAQRAALAAADDPATLRRWHARALTAARAADIFLAS